MVASLGVHAGLLLLCFFLVAWSAPDPPLPEYGIELNFGMDVAGSGDIQPETPVGAEASESREEVIEELPVPEPEEIAEGITEETAPEETQSAAPEVVSTAESPVVVEEKKETQPAEKPKEKPLEKVVESPREVKPEREAPKAVYQPRTDSKTPSTSAQKQGATGSQGDDVKKSGDKGDPAGSLDAKALYGKQGGGGGGVSLRGFNGFGAPYIETPALPDESYGVYEFRVKVDDQGYVISVTPVTRGLSFEAERRLKATIQKLQFVPKGVNLPPQSEGTITFKVVSAEN